MVEPIGLSLDADVRGIVRVGLARAEPVVVGARRPPLHAEIEQMSHTLRHDFGGTQPADIPGIQKARQLYRAFGIDPTRTRPSSEALLRRVLHGKPLPAVNNAVDLCNMAAVAFLLPLGLYDAERIRGEVHLRRGLPGEHFEGIRKERVNLEGRLTLYDEAGPFGNPTSDSLRTCVGENTRSLWVVIFAPASVETEALRSHADYLCDTMSRHLGDEVETYSTVMT
jgi:DNA/RNA-binding domain of Phe-tRNA-synthetase-like protein